MRLKYETQPHFSLNQRGDRLWAALSLDLLDGIVETQAVAIDDLANIQAIGLRIDPVDAEANTVALALTLHIDRRGSQTEQRLLASLRLPLPLDRKGKPLQQAETVQHCLRFRLNESYQLAWRQWQESPPAVSPSPAEVGTLPTHVGAWRRSVPTQRAASNRASWWLVSAIVIACGMWLGWTLQQKRPTAPGEMASLEESIRQQIMQGTGIPSANASSAAAEQANTTLQTLKALGLDPGQSADNACLVK
ncbi:hypothetical protein [Parachitinimonas caeni]|uniref:Uncharacterized protein n=1 Tax=Parachitinimonas caeni TaxID=3031301 RepID=A0ABT7DUV9_9NEIS|nr:hypothetical protein [Parachitinimonas caeni]MDK2123860.1 hypothetical protein [Parachitinimonas caeni]